MAKKKSKMDVPFDSEDFDAFSAQITNFLNENNINEDDFIAAMELMLSGQDINELMDEKVYRYQTPDYSPLAKPLSADLKPVMSLSSPLELNDVYHAAILALAKMPNEQRDEILFNALYYILANREELYKDHEYGYLSLCIIEALMVYFDVKGATDALLEMLKQNSKFFATFIDGFEVEYAYTISKLCHDDLEKLQQYMYVDGFLPETYSIVAIAVVTMPVDDPDMRPAAVDWFRRLFDHYLQSEPYLPIIDSTVYVATQLHAVELVPVIRELYDKYDVPYLEIASADMLETLLKDGNQDHSCSYVSFPELFDELIEGFKTRDIDDELLPDDDEEDLSAEVETSYDGYTYTLEITLADAPLEIKRVVKVPSNIRLTALADVILIAMGWENCHLWQFSKNKIHYCCPIQLEDGLNEDDLPAAAFALNEVIDRKNSKFEFEYDFGDGWIHTVRIIDKEKTGYFEGPIVATEAINACPPEDCGGVWGYADLLEAISDKKHPEHDEYRDWVGPRFNPTKVSLSKINTALKKYSKYVGL